MGRAKRTARYQTHADYALRHPARRLEEVSQENYTIGLIPCQLLKGA